jgi:hypothetical protein
MWKWSGLLPAAQQRDARNEQRYTLSVITVLVAQSRHQVPGSGMKRVSQSGPRPDAVLGCKQQQQPQADSCAGAAVLPGLRAVGQLQVSQ